MESSNLLVIFATGLTTGGLSCLALQGGLLTSVLAKREEKFLNEPGTNNFAPITLPVVSFLGSKLFIHTILGALLGFLGSTITLSPITRGWLQVFIGLYLFGIAGNLLNLHPFFRYFVIKPPKFLAKLARNESKSNSIFAPAILGLMTVFIPCAVTQAMEVVAIGTGSPLYGAAIMFAFILGTSPTFMIFGFLISKGSATFQKYFPTVAATAMFGMSIYSVNAGTGLMGSPYTIQNFIEAASVPRTNNFALITNNSVLGDQVQTATINVFSNGYSPRNITLKKGVLTRVTLITDKVYSCASSFTIPALNINKLLPATGKTILEFTPTRTGPLAFSCSMGMYTGRFNIVN